MFDALWIRKYGKWLYLICLFDVKINTILARSLVESESTEIIEQFLKTTLCNQKKKYIPTDLKVEYRLVIDKININQQFCLFHTKQKINRDIKDYIDEKNPYEEEIKIITHYKGMIFDILEAYGLETAQSMKNDLIISIQELLEVIHQIL